MTFFSLNISEAPAIGRTLIGLHTRKYVNYSLHLFILSTVRTHVFLMPSCAYICLVTSRDSFHAIFLLTLLSGNFYFDSSFSGVLNFTPLVVTLVGLIPSSLCGDCLVVGVINLLGILSCQFRYDISPLSIMASLCAFFRV